MRKLEGDKIIKEIYMYRIRKKVAIWEQQNRKWFFDFLLYWGGKFNGFSQIQKLYLSAGTEGSDQHKCWVTRISEAKLGPEPERSVVFGYTQ